MGYRGDARYVGLFWSPLGDQLVTTDGVNSGTGQSWAWLSYRRHRAVAPLLEPFDLGSSEEDGTHMLVIDREANRASVAFATEARAFLAGQHPPQPPMTREEQEAVFKEIDRLYREMMSKPVDHEAIAREMAEQRGRVGRMMSWLYMCPAPEQGPTP
jgi:hypothetical protein